LSGTLCLSMSSHHLLLQPFTSGWRHSCFNSYFLTSSSDIANYVTVDFVMAIAILATLKNSDWLIDWNEIKNRCQTLGGLNGYVSGILISSMYVAPSYGVSGGPAISPRNSVNVSFFSSNFIWHFATCPTAKHHTFHWHNVNKFQQKSKSTQIHTIADADICSLR